MFNPIGGQCGIGAPVSERIGGESFVRHIGNDKLIFDFHEGSGTTVHDKSHCGNDGTFGAGAAAPTWGRNSLYFDGGDSVDLTGITHGIGTGAFTFIISLDSLIAAINYFFDQETNRFIFAMRTNIISNYVATWNDIYDDPTSLSPIIMQMTRDISGNLECYVNGDIGNKGTSNTSDMTYDGTSGMALGAKYDGAGNWVTGTMYSFRILNKGLSGIECQQEYLVNKFRGNN